MRKLGLLKELSELGGNLKLPPSELRELQGKKLRKMLAYAYARSPYYRRSFQEAGITEENLHDAPLSAFPTLTKKQLLTYFDGIVTVPVRQSELRRFDEKHSAGREAYQGQYHLVHSSGSTGSPGYFLYDNQAWNTMLLGIIRGALWGMSMPDIAKLLANGPRIAYLAATDGRYGGVMAVGDGIDGLGAEQLHLDIKMPLQAWIEKLWQFHPNVIIGYPSAVKILAELVERGEVRVAAQRVITCGELLEPGLRRYLEKVFGLRVVNFYGASESLALGVEMEPEEGILLFDDLNVIEAAEGKIYLTSLYNFAQPLIRYELTDQLTLVQPTESSNYPLTRAVGVLGRNEEMLWFRDRNGKREFLHPLAIEGFCVPGLLDYQFKPTGDAGFEMLAETLPGTDRNRIREELTRQMTDILAEKGLDHVAFSICFVQRVMPDPITGKKKLILREKGEIACA